MAADLGSLVFVGGACGIPTTAKALSFNVTIVGPTLPGSLVVYPGGSPLPFTSNINFSPGEVRANNAVVHLGPGGTLAILSGQPGGGTVHVILDVNGYFE